MLRRNILIPVILCVVALASGCGTVGSIASVNAGTASEIRYDYTNGESSVIVGDTDEEFEKNSVAAEELRSEGYIINFPTFEKLNSTPTETEQAIYSAITVPIIDYANGIAKDYNNKAKLDYTVEQENDMLTITFSGFGYLEGSDSEPITLDRVFIFDIKDVNADKLPTLISN